MQTKLTLRLNEQLITLAKSHAKEQGKSLSQLIADYFQAINPVSEKKALPPLTASLKGVLKSKRVQIGKEDYQHYLEKKHL